VCGRQRNAKDKLCVVSENREQYVLLFRVRWLNGVAWIGRAWLGGELWDPASMFSRNTKSKFVDPNIHKYTTMSQIHNRGTSGPIRPGNNSKGGVTLDPEGKKTF